MHSLKNFLYLCPALLHFSMEVWEFYGHSWVRIQGMDCHLNYKQN